MVGVASGMSLGGLIPIVHTIAPFLTERCYEQLKIDFGYQKLGGNFISVGASYDYSTLGVTHQCPSDISILKQIPNFEICVPGTAKEFDSLFSQSYNNGNPTYYRLSEYKNNIDIDVEFGKANIIKKGELATIIVVGNLLDKVLDVTKNINVTILYYTTIFPFDSQMLKNNCESGKILLCEPYYMGGLDYKIISTMYPKPIVIDHIGVQYNFSEHYGTYEEHNQENGITIENISRKLYYLLNI
jgi:transketolase